MMYNQSNIQSFGDELIDTYIITVPERIIEAQTIANETSGTILCDHLYKGSWFSHQRALKSCHGSHILVLEDDISLCKDFIETVEQILSIFPDRIISFINFSYSKKINSILTKNKIHFFNTYGTTGQAVLYPKELALKFLRWDAVNISCDPRNNKATTDPRRWAFSMATDTPILITNPNLVEHNCPDSTMMKESNQTLSFNRVSSNFIGNELSGLNIDWKNNISDIPTYSSMDFSGRWESINKDFYDGLISKFKFTRDW